MKKFKFENPEFENQENSLKGVKGALAALLALFAFNQPAKAKDSNLEQALKASKSSSELYQIGGFRTSIWGNKYNSPEIRYYSDNIRLILRNNFDKYQQYLAIIKKKFNGVTVKGSVAYSKIKDLNINGVNTNPETITTGAEIGKKGDNYYIAGGVVNYHTNNLGDFPKNSGVVYGEGVKRIDTKKGTIEGVVSAQKKYNLGDNRINVVGEANYYPTDNIKVGVSGNSLGDFYENDYQANAGIVITENGKISFTVGFTKNLSKYSKAYFEIRNNVKGPIDFQPILERLTQIPTPIEQAKQDFVKEKLSPKFTKPTDQNITNPEPTPEYNAQWKTLPDYSNETWDDTEAHTLIDDLTQYVENLPEGSTFKITPVSGPRAKYVELQGTKLVRIPGDTDDLSGNNTIRITIIYPDGTEGPSTELTFHLNNG